MRQSVLPNDKLRELEILVREYISELSNPSPDLAMRQIYIARIAKAVGEEDPREFLRRWNKEDHKARMR